MARDMVQWVRSHAVQHQDLSSNLQRPRKKLHMAAWSPVMAVDFQVQIGCQSNCTFCERCCLREIIQKVTEQGLKFPLWVLCVQVYALAQIYCICMQGQDLLCTEELLTLRSCFYLYLEQLWILDSDKIAFRSSTSDYLPQDIRKLNQRL